MNIENIKGLIEALNGDARNAMHSILGFLELVGEGPLDPAQIEYIEACRAAAERHFRGIEDVRIILDLVPQERSVIASFAPAELFGRIAEAIAGFAGRNGVAVLRNVDSSVPPLVEGDLDRIGPALFRISEAAISAIENCGVHLSLRASPSPDATDLTFEMVASGTVLPPLLMSALQHDDFEFEASLSGTAAVGLVAARRLANALGGHVEASADSLAGTRIAVTFHLAVPSASPAPPQLGAEPVAQAQHALRILVAEDSEDSFQLFKAYLRDLPHAVERAVNGEEAVELASTGAFDLVFMDICMPLMDGYAATRRIRELETGTNRARIPIVVLSAEDLRSQRRQGALAGCSGHLSKPLRKQELLAAIGAYSMRPTSAN